MVQFKGVENFVGKEKVLAFGIFSFSYNVFSKGIFLAGCPSCYVYG